MPEGYGGTAFLLEVKETTVGMVVMMMVGVMAVVVVMVMVG
jgi:hypothetical protein